MKWYKKLWDKIRPHVNWFTVTCLLVMVVSGTVLLSDFHRDNQPDPHASYHEVTFDELRNAIVSQNDGKAVSAVFFHFAGGTPTTEAPGQSPAFDFVEVELPGRKIRTPIHGPDEELLKALLNQKGSKIHNQLLFKESSGWSDIFSFGNIVSLLFLVLFGFMLFGGSRRMGGPAGAFGFGKARMRRFVAAQGKVTFADVAGADTAKEDLGEIVQFLRDPEKFQRLGGRVPRGVLLVGPPGTGKTLLARAIAGEADVPFFSISGSDFVEMFVGVGASRVRDMFEQAKKEKKAIIFVDEIDAVGRSRGAGTGGGNDEREQTLNQLLIEMDGFEANETVIIIAATNRPDVLDKALLRPGRFDRQIQIDNPTVDGREEILKIHARKVPLAADVDLKTIARGTPGFSGADLMNLVNEAALLAGRRQKDQVERVDFEDAKDKILMGAERPNLLTKEERKLTAYHEGGHAVMAIETKRKFPDAKVDPVHKATILPRGRALGMVQQLPEGDKLSASYRGLLCNLTIAMGGRAAEEVVFGKDAITSGAQSDINFATNMARAMVKRWGYSELLGPVALAESYDPSEPSTLAESTRRKIDIEIRRLNDTALREAVEYLEKNRKVLDRVAAALLTYETLTGEELERVFDGLPIRDESSQPAHN